MPSDTELINLHTEGVSTAHGVEFIALPDKKYGSDYHCPDVQILYYLPFLRV